MASAAQSAANAANAQFSTGPKTVDGKANSAKNAVRHGLFALPEHLAPADRARIEELFEALHKGIPELHATYEFQIRQYAIAMWRSEQYFLMESSFLNSAVHDELAKPETARLVAEHGDKLVLGRAMRSDAEGANVFPRILRYEARVMKELHSAREVYEQLMQMAAMNKLRKATVQEPAPAEEQPDPTAEPAEAPGQTPRNAPCPCGSGTKFKRCCGKDAPAVLHEAAA
jgi:uncharacterized protein YecA (UPF0149 family)